MDTGNIITMKPKILLQWKWSSDYGFNEIEAWNMVAMKMKLEIWLQWNCHKGNETENENISSMKTENIVSMKKKA